MTAADPTVAGALGSPARSARDTLILDRAGEAFAQGGYERVSMDRIAAGVGLSKPILYAAFGSKRGLYDAYLDRVGTELLSRMAGVGATGLRAVVEEFLAFVSEHRTAWIVLHSELSAGRPPAETASRLRARAVGLVREMLGAGGPGQDAAPASEAVAEAIVGAGESLANWWLSRPDVPREDVVEWLVTLVRASVAAGAHHPAGSGR